jgi:transcriptional regulator with XRE-family HTH domain
LKRRGAVDQAALIETLKKARLTANLSQPQLAERLGRPQSYVAKMEKGRITKIGVHELSEWADACETEEIALFAAYVVRRLRVR